MIRISKLADYAVVILSVMAGSDDDLISAAKLSSMSSVPEPTVSKILKMLSKSGMIESTRGIRGGYALCKDPEDITLEDIIEAIDGPVIITECLRKKDVKCALSAVCGMHSCWCEVNQAITQALSSVSLHSIMLDNNEICAKLDD